MRTVHEVSQLAGISVRTLHHYDEIGLLPPTRVTEAGYRLYDDAALCRLQSILLFRELQFPLKEIKAILDSPNFDPVQALRQQITLLEMQHKHLGELIAYAREIQQKGAEFMSFQAFDKSGISQYAQEAKAKWGHTDAYRECEQKQKVGQDMEQTNQRMLALFAEMGAMRHLRPDDAAVQQKVAALQALISEGCYTCTTEILNGLGQMYVDDERFRNNIDKVGGEGTAELVSKAINAYCAARQ